MLFPENFIKIGRTIAKSQKYTQYSKVKDDKVYDKRHSFDFSWAVLLAYKRML